MNLFSLRERDISAFLSLFGKYLRKNPRIHTYSYITQKKFVRLVGVTSFGEVVNPPPSPKRVDGFLRHYRAGERTCANPPPPYPFKGTVVDQEKGIVII